MQSKIILWALALVTFHLISVISARSPLQFGGSSRLSRDQKAALLKLVQGPIVNQAKVKKNNKVDLPVIDNEVEIRTLAPPHNDDDGQLDTDGCMKKVVMVEEIEFDTEIKCQHVSQKSCFESYTTNFKKTKAEECEESFKKECEIEYFKIPKEEKVEICNEMLNRDCDATDGEVVCSKEYETICETVHEEQVVTEDVPNCTVDLEEECLEDDMGNLQCDNVPKRTCTVTKETNVKLIPKTECRRVDVDVCGPESCPLVTGERICKDEIKTVIHEVPQESCNMVPRKVCNIVAKVVPTLEPVKHCIDIPKEMCAKSRINPVRKTRPVVRKWCLNQDGTLPNTVYVVSLADSSITDGTSTLEAYLVNATTGQRLEGCSKQFSPHDYCEQMHNGQIFGIIGQQRELVSCGSEIGECHRMNFDTGYVDVSDVLSNSPGPFAASFVDPIDGSWLALGGLAPVDGVDESWRHASITSNFNDLAFTDSGINSVFNHPQNEIRIGQRSCLLKFVSPNGTPITFFVTTINPSRTQFVIKRGDNEFKTNYHQEANLSLGDQPICGYSVVTEADAPSGGEIGDTLVYYLVKDQDNSDQIVESKLLIPTSSEEAMEAYFAEGEEAESVDVESNLFPGVDMVEKNPDPDNADENGLNGRLASTVWLGDNRSLVLLSYNNVIAQFDANTGEFSELAPEEERPESNGILFACRAKYQDKINMGCNY